MKHNLASLTLLLGLSMISACREDSPPLPASATTSKGPDSLVSDETDEAPYCYRSGQCIPNSSLCCDASIKLCAGSFGTKKYCCWHGGAVCTVAHQWICCSNICRNGHCLPF
jgi:hypothetical protein